MSNANHDDSKPLGFGSSAELGLAPERTYTRAQLLAAIEVERHACSIAVWMTLQDALADDADDKGLDGWMREAEQRIKNRSANDPDVRALRELEAEHYARGGYLEPGKTYIVG